MKKLSQFQSIKSIIIWDVMLCIPVDFYQTARLHIPKDNKFYSH
jgi:hypothetical protein